jgi:V/A-type H+-transporting ATPase subunit C
LKPEDFIEASALIRIKEKRVLNQEGIERVLDAPSPADALSILTSSTEYDFSQLHTPAFYEQTLKDQMAGVYNELYSLVGEKNRALIDVIAAKYDYNSIKVALKALFTNTIEENRALIYSVTGLDGDALIDYVSISEEDEKDNKVNPDLLPPGEAPKTPKELSPLPNHLKIAVDKTKEAFIETNDAQYIDITADKEMFSYMLALAKKIDEEITTLYVQKSIDYYNLRILLRITNMHKDVRFLQRSLIDGGSLEVNTFVSSYGMNPEDIIRLYAQKHFPRALKVRIESHLHNQNFSDLEKELDNELIIHIKDAKYVAFGPEILFAYLVSKENEIRQIRILLAGKVNEVPSDTIRERLRENYA